MSKKNRTQPTANQNKGSVTEPVAPVENNQPVDNNEPVKETKATEPVIKTDGTATGTTVATPTKQQLLDQQRKLDRERKAAEKTARKAANAAKRADGVIGTIKQALQQPNGTTRAEVLATLTSKFPTRDPMGMVVTVGIQFSRLAKSTGVPIDNKVIEGRGRVYGFRNTIQFPPVVVEGTPEVAAPAATQGE